MENPQINKGFIKFYELSHEISIFSTKVSRYPNLKLLRVFIGDKGMPFFLNDSAEFILQNLTFRNILTYIYMKQCEWLTSKTANREIRITQIITSVFVAFRTRFFFSYSKMHKCHFYFTNYVFFLYIIFFFLNYYKNNLEAKLKLEIS